MSRPDPSQFRFLPNQGFEYFGDDNSLVIKLNSIGISGARLTDEELLSFASASQQYSDSVDEISSDLIHNQKPRVLTKADFRPYRNRYAYKFMTRDAYENYVKRGSFLVSSLLRFRDLERQGDVAGDRFEGLSFCYFDVRDRFLVIRCVSGFNYYNLSLCADLTNADHMREKFGSVILKIDVPAFAHALLRLISAESLEVRKVRYSDLKVMRSTLPYGTMVDLPTKLTPI